MRLKAFETNNIFTSLAAERQMTSLVDKEIIAAGEEFAFVRSDWVTLYYDRSHLVTSDDGMQQAYRAITTRGEKLWLVFSKGKTRGYHAECACPFEAFEEAQNALDRRRQIKADWRNVRRLARDLRLRRQRFDIRIEDAEMSPLCAMGTRHFLRAIGVPNLSHISGFKLAWLMLLEPQLGFVIHQAAMRQGVRPLKVTRLVPS